MDSEFANIRNLFATDLFFNFLFYSILKHSFYTTMLEIKCPSNGRLFILNIGHIGNMFG